MYGNVRVGQYQTAKKKMDAVAPIVLEQFVITLICLLFRNSPLNILAIFFLAGEIVGLILNI